MCCCLVIGASPGDRENSLRIQGGIWCGVRLLVVPNVLPWGRRDPLQVRPCKLDGGLSPVDGRFDPMRILSQILMLVSLGLTGCAVPRPSEPSATYLLEPALASPAPVPTGALTLGVSPVRAWPQVDSAAMSYVREPGKLEHYANSRWIDTPARLLSPLLRRALEHSGTFAAVVAEPSPVTTQLSLEAELETLQQEFLTTPSQVRLALRVSLIDLGHRRVLGARRFEVVEPAPSDDAYGGVRAANGAVSRLLAKVVEFCISLETER
jgi:cholesterol transport system auxiliary component